MEGVCLSYLQPGLTYDVEPMFGRYLIACAGATQVRSTKPALVVPIDGEDDYVAEVMTRGVSVADADRAVEQDADDRTIKVRPFRRKCG